jgi:hypothetical protein
MDLAGAARPSGAGRTCAAEHAGAGFVSDACWLKDGAVCPVL